MASAVLANRNETNWPQSRANGRGGALMGKVPFLNPNPNSNFNKRQAQGEINGFQNDESPALTQSASNDTSLINHHHRSSSAMGFNQYVSFNLSSCSRKELLELKSQLITELEQIRKLTSRIDSSQIQFRANQLKKSSKTSGNKRSLPSISGNELKRSNSVIVNSMKACSQILTKVMKHKHGWIFNNPVDVAGLGLHDYYDIIKKPMDLGSVKSRLGKNLYSSPTDFAADVRLTLKNAMTYNPKGHDVYIMADQLLERFEELFLPLCVKLEEDRPLDPVYNEELQASSWNNCVEIEEKVVKKENPKQIVKKLEQQPKAQASSSNPPSLQSPVKTPSPLRAPQVKPVKQPKPKAKDPNKREMRLEEKHKLGLGLQSLPQEKMEQVVQIVKKRNGHLKQDGDEIELDIEAVDTETLWELDRFVTNWKKLASKIKRQALMGNVMSVPSNKSSRAVLAITEKIEVGVDAKKPRKGEAGEEDVDIGDDDMPMTSFPPVEIEKDGGGGAHAGSSSSSSGSSSSDDSSSSDSDSEGSSSGSDSDDNAQS